jgi:hypothetical protein
VAQHPLPRPRPPAKRRPVRSGEWGLVAITRGRFKGHLAEYDDDEPGGFAIVFVFSDEPGDESTGASVRLSSLGALTAAEKDWFRRVYDNDLVRARADRRWRERRARGEVREEADDIRVTVSSPSAVLQEEATVIPVGDLRAEISVLLRDNTDAGTRIVTLVHHCTMPFPPHEGMTLIVGAGEDAEFVDVGLVQYRFEGRTLEIEGSVPEEMWEPLEDGGRRHIKPIDHLEQLQAAGFRIESDMTLPGDEKPDGK